MKLDNSAYSSYNFCAQHYHERYEAPNDELVQIQVPSQLAERPGRASASRGIQLIRESESLDFGTRLHQLLHERRLLRLGLRPAGLQCASASTTGASGSDDRGTTEDPGPACHGDGLHCEVGARGSVDLALAADSEPATTRVPDAVSDGGTEPLQYFQPSPECANPAIEAEAQATLAAYDAHYVRDLEYLESERTHVLQLPRLCPHCAGQGQPALPQDQRVCGECNRQFTQHELVVKLDAVVRHADGTIGPFDTKTESRSGYNDRASWAGRTQGRLYLWALKALYPDQRVSRLIVDVVQRASPKMRRGPVFIRLDDISSTPEALEEAIRNLNYVADRIEEHRRTNWWPANMNNCKKGWERCDFYSLHIDGRTPENLRKFRAAEQYLEV